MPGWTADMMGSGFSAGAANAVNGNSTPSQTATGSTQATAYPLTTSTTEFTTVAASTGAVLPGTGGRIQSGDIVFVINQGANPLAVYPPVGFKIGLSATNTSVAVASGKTALFQARGDGNYFSLSGA